MFKSSLSAAAILLATCATPLLAENDAFSSGWTLDAQTSSLNFLSVKKGSVMEMSSFETLDGVIDEDGNVSLKIPLDSVNTAVDLRNVRMRFLFFETFLHPEATITAQIPAAQLADLAAVGTKEMTLPVTIDLHGTQQSVDAALLVTLIGRDRVSVSSITPVILKVEDFDLLGGIAKLEEAASVVISPVTAVTFNFAFDRNDASEPAAAPIVATNVALEPEGNFSHDACAGRFEILSRSGNIAFQTGSADLSPASAPLLNSVADIASKCPDMVISVSGHTDSNGKAEYNQWLSEQRSASVVQYLIDTGLPASSFVSRGYGETQPIASNSSSKGRERNRRIEFAVDRFMN